MAVSTTDYFTNGAVVSSATVDGRALAAVSSGTFGPALAPGLHSLQITAPGYATYNGAIQVPGGAVTRTITLFPESPAVAAFVAGINADRATDGRTAVQLDNQLTIAAYDHAADMAAQGYYAHFDPNGFAPTTRSLLLGSEMVGDENIDVGAPTWADAEYAFVQNEKNQLPNKSAADCVAYGDPHYAGHYCNLIYPGHNWVGLGVVSNPSSLYTTYYDQEFGDLYGMVDTTAVAREPAINTVASLIMAGSTPAAESEVISTMPMPVPISVATLNADATCASACPSADQWYATVWYAPSDFGQGLGVPITLDTTLNQIYEPQVEFSGAFSATGASTIYWPSGSVMPATYHDSTLVVQTQSRYRSTLNNAGGSKGFVVPNGPRPNRLR